jgi:hypothetical protein
MAIEELNASVIGLEGAKSKASFPQAEQVGAHLFFV